MKILLIRLWTVTLPLKKRKSTGGSYRHEYDNPSSSW
jgi:hypothetical protein